MLSPAERLSAAKAPARAPFGSLAGSLSSRSAAPVQRFRDAEEAWLWTMAALVARRDGARYVANQGKVSRPCEPDDVVRSLDALYRQRRIELLHARVMRIWGERGVAPNPRHPAEYFDWTVWKEAMDRLEWPLRVKGIVG